MKALLAWLVAPALILGGVVSPVLGQERMPQLEAIALMPGAKGEALVAALTFSSEFNADSVGIAACRIEKAVGEEDYLLSVVPVLGERLIEPMPRDDPDEARCWVSDFQEDGKVRLFLEEMVEVRRQAGLLAYPVRVGFEVQLQVLRGLNTREVVSITVGSVGAHLVDQVYRAESWKVSRYEALYLLTTSTFSTPSAPPR